MDNALPEEPELEQSRREFRNCMETIDSLGECKGCAATLDMLKRSEEPQNEYGVERFGESYPLGMANLKPETSTCDGVKVWP